MTMVQGLGRDTLMDVQTIVHVATTQPNKRVLEAHFLPHTPLQWRNSVAIAS
jgi:hypothetical protein